MVAYFVRRLAQAVVAMLALTFVLYSLVVYFPGGMYSQARDLTEGRETAVGGSLCFVCFDYKLYKPWPANYFAWLFDPADTGRLDPNDNTKVVPKGLDISIGDVHFRGSGILTGDWGESYSPATRYMPALDVYGIDPVWFYSLCLGTIFSFMVLALLQRRGRQPVSGSTRVLADARWRLTDLCRMS